MGKRRAAVAFALGLGCAVAACPPSPVAAAPEIIRGELAKQYAGYQMLLIRPTGGAAVAVVDQAGSFALAAERNQQRGATLTLLTPAGTVVGPVVLRTSPKHSYLQLGAGAAGLGKLTVYNGYAVAKVSGSAVRGSELPTTAADRPAGAGNRGLVATAGVDDPLGLAESGVDSDEDGLINLFDRDDDGDLIADSRDPDASVTASAWTSLQFTPADALNAHTSDLPGEQLAAALSSPGRLQFHMAVDSAGLAADPAGAAFVHCPVGSWCAGPAAQLLAPTGVTAEAFPTQSWADYPGTTWSTAPDGTVSTAATAVGASGHALHTTLVQTLQPWGVSTAGAAAWSADVEPRATTLAELPASDQVLTAEYRGADGDSRTLPVALGDVLATAPAINEVSVGSVAGETLTTVGGQLAFSLWRPQRLSADAHLADAGGLAYSITLRSGDTEHTCTADRFSDLAGLVTQGNAIIDERAADQPVLEAGPISLRLDVAGCLSDAGLPAGTATAPLSLILRADEGAQESGSVAVTYQLISE
ncbi:MAG: hypothetical protein ACOYEV_09080 [Candidatus Nanopelagicales bacterium]